MHEAKPFSKLTICLKPFRFVKKKCHNKFVTSDAFAVDIQQSNLTTTTTNNNNNNNIAFFPKQVGVG